MKISRLLLALFCVLPALAKAGLAQTPTPTPGFTNAHSFSPSSTTLGTSLWTTPSGVCGVGQPGCSGAIQGATLWDGTMDENNNRDPAHIRFVSPEEKNYYVVVRATVTCKINDTVPNTLQVVAERIKYANNNASGAISVVTGSDPDDAPQNITLYRIAPEDHDNEGPTIDATGQFKTYTYRTYVDPDWNHYRIAGTDDWHIDRLKGRWRLKLAADNTVSVEFKVDKRTQITQWASAWAYYWPYRPDATKPAPGTPGAAVDTTYNSTIAGHDLFTQCHSFAGYVYNRMGIYDEYVNSQALGNACSNLSDTATAVDDGPAALRLFTGRNVTTPGNHSDHTGIIIGYGLIYGGQMVDINNPEDSYKGLGFHSLTVGGQPLNPPNRTLPDPGHAQENGKDKSWLKVLDEE